MLYPRLIELDINRTPGEIVVIGLGQRVRLAPRVTPIHSAGYAVYKVDLINEPAHLGEAVEILAAADDAEQAASVGRLLNGGLRSEGIVVLLANRPKDALQNMLQHHRLPHAISWAQREPARNNSVLVETVGRYEGREAPAVGLSLGNDIVAREEWEQLYAGTTRAKSMLAAVASSRARAVLRR